MKYILIFALTIIGLIGLKHQASWGVFFALLMLLLFYSYKIPNGKIYIAVIVISMVIGGGLLWNDVIEPLYSKEISAYKGELDDDRTLNGRWIRWQIYFDEWHKMHSINHYIGVGTVRNPIVKIMMGGGMHSDYVRFLFSTGIVGILFYLLFYLGILFRARKYPKPISYLMHSSVAIMLLYAITANPFGSLGMLLYVTLIGLSIASIPPKFFIDYNKISKYG